MSSRPLRAPPGYRALRRHLWVDRPAAPSRRAGAPQGACLHGRTRAAVGWCRPRPPARPGGTRPARRAVV